MDKSGTVCSVTSFDNLNDSKVRFLIESKVRVFPTEERWLLRGLKSKSQTEQFHVSGSGPRSSPMTHHWVNRLTNDLSSKLTDYIKILNPDMKLKRREIKKEKQHIQFYRLKVKQPEQEGQKWPRSTLTTRTRNHLGTGFLQATNLITYESQVMTHWLF